jgi:two-component system invasion response regulator UvrY
MVREGIASLLARARPDLHVVDPPKDGVTLAEVTTADLVIVERSHADGSVLQLLTDLRRRHVRALVLAGRPEDRGAVRMLRAGADGYLTKDQPATVLLEAIDTVLRGGRFVSPRLAELLVEDLDRADRDPHESLSNREHDILVMLGNGRRPSCVASSLHLSPSTVSTYIQRIKSKLGLDSVPGLVHYAVRTGLTE